MKYIKMYEFGGPITGTNNKYQIGDYVLASRARLGKPNFYAKIIKVEPYLKQRPEIKSVGYSYHLDSDLYSDRAIVSTDEESIIRKLNNEEIEEFEMKYNANKYNM